MQCSALGKIEPAELARILRDEGLNVATHTSLDRLEKEPAKVIEEHQMWGCHFTALGHFGPKDATRQTWLDFADRFNRVAGGFRQFGRSGGISQSQPWAGTIDGQTALGLLIEKLHQSVWLEIDTFWITHGGGDPAAWIDSVAGDIPCVHLKDMQIGPDNKPRMAEVGRET